MLNVEEKYIDFISEAIHCLLSGKIPEKIVLPDKYAHNEIGQLTEYVNKLIDDDGKLADFVQKISIGDLNAEAPDIGLRKIHSLKNLQSNLSHLTWKTQQIARGDFKQRVDFMGDFSAAFNSMIEKLKTSFESINKQNKFQKLIAEISGEFVNATADNIDSKINKMLKLSGEFFDVDRSYLFQYSEDGLYYTNTHEWCREGVESVYERMQNVCFEDYPWWREQVKEAKPIYIPDITQLPPQAENEKQEFKAQNVKAILCLPIIMNEKAVGFLGFDLAEVSDFADQDEITFFAVAANIVSDALERVKVELALRESERKSRDAAEAKGRFLANMSHEIRTPMNGVIGMIELLISSGLDEKQAEYAQIVRSSGISMLSLINDILDFSKIEAGKLELDYIDFDLREVARQTIQMLKVIADNKGIELNLNIADDVHTDLKGDSGRLRQVLVNIAGNAVKFTDKGKVNINVLCDQSDNTKTTLRFEIKDTGIGIPAEQQKLLFNAFEQLHSSGAKRFKGTGLGLAISKSLATLLGGKIGVSSEPGKGSMFWFTAVFDKSDKPAAKQHREAVKAEDLPLKDLRLLIAEDNLLNQKVVLNILQHLGLTADVVDNGKEAIEALEQRNYDLVLMDVQMPVMDGIEATIAIRSGERKLKNSKIPIIAMTANAMKGDREKYLEAGMDDYISKPITPASILDLLSRWVNKKASSKQSER